MEQYLYTALHFHPASFPPKLKLATELIIALKYN